MGALVSLLRSETELINCTDETLRLFECGSNDHTFPKGELSMELKPNKTKKIGASHFLDRQKASNIAAVVRVHRPGRNDYEDVIFSGRHFKLHRRMHFRLSEDRIEVGND